MRNILLKSSWFVINILFQYIHEKGLNSGVKRSIFFLPLYGGEREPCLPPRYARSPIILPFMQKTSYTPALIKKSIIATRQQLTFSDSDGDTYIEHPREPPALARKTQLLFLPISWTMYTILFFYFGLYFVIMIKISYYKFVNSRCLIDVGWMIIFLFSKLIKVI